MRLNQLSRTFRQGLRAAALTAGFAAVAGLVVPSAASAADTQSLTLYAGQHRQMVQMLVDDFEDETGIDVDVRYGGGPELAKLIAREGEETPADVIFTENSPVLMRLQEKGLLATLDQDTLKQIPAAHRSDKGQWVGVLARENVLTYNPDLVAQSDLPDSVLGFAKPQWKGKVGIHLTSPDIMPLIRTIAVKKGEDAALNWLKGMKKNAKLYEHSSGLVSAVNDGDVAVGISNSYYYYGMRSRQGDDTVSRIHHFTDGDPGGVINTSGVAVTAHAPHAAAASKFVGFMVSQDAQEMLAQSDTNYEYPLRPGVEAKSVLKPLNELEPPQMTVSQLGDNKQAIHLLQEAGLL